MAAASTGERFDRIDTTFDRLDAMLSRLDIEIAAIKAELSMVTWIASGTACGVFLLVLKSF